jgi:hypothetical protein
MGHQNRFAQHTEWSPEQQVASTGLRENEAANGISRSDLRQ